MEDMTQPFWIAAIRAPAKTARYARDIGRGQARRSLSVSTVHPVDMAGVYRDLARISGRAAHEPIRQTAAMLLERMQTLGAATHGALFVADDVADGDASWPRVTGMRVLAAAGVAGAGLSALWAGSPWRGRTAETGNPGTKWIRFTFPLAPATRTVSHESAPERTAESGVALLCLGWDATTTDERTEETALRALDEVEDGLRAVVVQALSAERLRERDDEATRVSRLAREAEETRSDWQQAFDAISDPICIVGADYRLIRVNAAYLRLFGEEHAYRDPHMCFSGQNATEGPCAGCPLPMTVRTERPAFVQQERIVPTGPGGALERRIFQRWTYPVIDASGQVNRVVELVKDVTDEERIREEAGRAQALREADRLKAELLGTVSHELRSPLTMIKGYSATLLRHERRLPREERREFLVAINDACDRLSMIIERLLQMSQLETGLVRLDMRTLDLTPMVEAAVEMARADARKEGQPLNIGWRIADDGPGARGNRAFLVEGDSRRLRDVLDNLLENARKYSPEGGSVEVVLRAASAPMEDAYAGEFSRGGATTSPSEQTRKDDRFVEVSVYDTGIGIPQEHLTQVFERFHRVDSRLTREVAGMGLGLALCKRIVELHGGTIWAESRTGEGSAFHVLLPVASDDR